jgi:hypothetical protein
MSKNLGLDIGYGDVKWAYFEDNNKIKFGKFSSVVAKAPNEAEDMPIFEKTRWYLGDIALMVGSSKIVDLEEYLNLQQVSPLLTYKTLKELNLSPEQIGKMGIGLSFAQMERAQDFLNRNKKFTIDGQKYDFTDKLVLVPQGVGAKYALEHFYPEIKNSSYLIIDIGSNTIDVIEVIAGVVRPENVKGYAGKGVIHILRNLQSHIAQEFEESLSIKEVKKVLDDKKFSIMGDDYDLSDVIKEFAKEYSDVTLKFLKNTYPHQFRKHPAIYIVGGGSHYIDMTNQQKNIKTVENSEYLNAIGNLIKANLEEKNKKA